MNRTEAWIKENLRIADVMPFEVSKNNLPYEKPEFENGIIKPRKERKLDNLDKDMFEEHDVRIDQEIADRIKNKYPDGLDYIGLGANGLAAKIRDKAGRWMKSKDLGKVIKITFNKEEADVAKSQINDKNSAMVKVFKVDDLKANSGVNAWLIEAEEVYPLKGIEKLIVNALMDDVFANKGIADDDGEIFKSGYDHVVKSPEKGLLAFFNSHHDKFFEIKADFGMVEFVWKKWTKMMDGLMTKWRPTDAAGTNVGQNKQGNYKLLDLGM